MAGQTVLEYLEEVLKFKASPDASDIHIEMLYRAVVGVFPYQDPNGPSKGKEPKKHKAGRSTESKGCFITGVTPEPRGYCCMYYPRDRKHNVNNVTGKRMSGSLYTHQAACLVKFGDVEYGKAKALGYECSHLCHNKDCIRPKHLVMEPAASNTIRNYCAAAGWCLGHGEARKCIFD